MGIFLPIHFTNPKTMTRFISCWYTNTTMVVILYMSIGTTLNVGLPLNYVLAIRSLFGVFLRTGGKQGAIRVEMDFVS